MNIGYYGFRQVYISSCLVSFTVIRLYVAARYDYKAISVYEDATDVARKRIIPRV